MFFEMSLYVSLIIFGLGIVYKVVGWFRHGFWEETAPIPPGRRCRCAITGILRTFTSRKFFTLFKAFIFEVVVQTRTLKEDRFRWGMHLLIYWGFMVLLLMHALGNIITITLFPNYYSSVNPFLFVRDIAGVMVLIGLGMAVYRRIVLKNQYIRTSWRDSYAIAILALILISGFFLEGVKITSHTAYERMVEDYAATDDHQDLLALESLWVEDYGVVSPRVHPPFERDILTLGKEVHEDNCAACHSSPRWAFAGYAVGKLASPFAQKLDRHQASAILWYIHILASFFGLAYLPFSKMFHAVGSPLNLLVNAVAAPEGSHPAAILTRQALELDACTHCGTCSFHCSTAVASERLGNINILPSERMLSIKALAAGNTLTAADLQSIREGIYLCTNCDRCTVVCPVGINLRELWFDVREVLLKRGYPGSLMLTPYSFYRGLNRDKISPEKYPRPLHAVRTAMSARFETKREAVQELTDSTAAYREALTHTSIGSNFSACFACENCSTVCPVVGNYPNPEEVLGLLPHQIMRSVGLGLKDMALGSMMLWDCVTCYQCQEHCPQGVHVTDILYELKNQASSGMHSSETSYSLLPGGSGNQKEVL